MTGRPVKPLTPKAQRIHEELRLHALQRAAADREIRELVRAGRHHGMTYAAIADALGESVSKIWHQINGPETKR